MYGGRVNNDIVAEWSKALHLGYSHHWRRFLSMSILDDSIDMVNLGWFDPIDQLPRGFMVHFFTTITMPAASICLLLFHCLTFGDARWNVHNMEDYGAVSGKDSTAAIHTTGKGDGRIRSPHSKEWSLPHISNKCHLQCYPARRWYLTGIRNEEQYPIVDLLPSYDTGLDAGGGLVAHHRRRHPLIWSVDATNVTICGTGTDWHHRRVGIVLVG